MASFAWFLVGVGVGAIGTTVARAQGYRMEDLLGGEVYEGKSFKDMPHWQQMAIIRNENQAVLDAVQAGASDRAEIARRTGMGQFRVELAIRRLERSGMLERS